MCRSRDIRVLVPCFPFIQENGYAGADTAVYTNISLEEDEAIYANLTKERVSLEEVQAYLNCSIDSQETSDEFMVNLHSALLFYLYILFV